uniref:leucine-rich PPR motif-containing protein, mitochondrial-like n=1 Tax=Myxine glutinosa TaxID=7769 RepID=UPI00358EFC37
CAVNHAQAINIVLRFCFLLSGTSDVLQMNNQGHVLSADQYLHLAKAQLSIGAVEEAQSIMERAKMHHPDIALDNTANSLLMTSLVKAGKFEETVELFKFMRKEGQFPNDFALRPWLKALARAGHLEGVDLFCKEHAALNMPSRIPPHFLVQCQILALITRDQLQQAVEVVEGMREQQADGHCPLYAVLKVLKEDGKDEAFDKFCAMADQQAQQFGKYDSLCEVLFVHLDRGELDEAKHLLQVRMDGWMEKKKRMSFGLIIQ